MLTPQQKMNRLREALRADTRPASTLLVERLDRCAVDWNGRYACRSPACPRCKRIHIRREQRYIQTCFGDYRNAELGLVSVVVGAVSDIADMGRLIQQSREGTRKRIAASRKADPMWNGVYLQGWHEIDAIGAHQVPHLPPNRRALVEKIAPLAFDSATPAWINTWHGIIHLNGLRADDVGHQFARQWRLAGQVDVRPFDGNHSVAENLWRITAYANKFDTSITLSDYFSDRWPVSWEVDFYSWLHNIQRNPFESLRLKVLPIDDKIPCNISHIKNNAYALEPMPCVFSRLPMYK